ncbi:MAG: hypothetical protein ACRBBW_13060 [Cellvibrionaceae bacterium]
MLDEKLKEFATERQSEYIDAVNELGSTKAVAKKFNVGQRSVSNSIKLVKEKAARKGLSPDHGMNRPAPDGFFLPKTTVQVGPDGDVERAWHRYAIDDERQQEIIKEAIAALGENLPRLKPVRPPKQVSSELANCYVVTDYHFGMMSWGEETGGDWDLSIAENLLVDWFAASIAMSPDAEVGIFAQLGDFLHFDGLESVTPTNRHVLDADTRLQKLIRVVIRVVRRVIDMLLAKHAKVHVLMAEGNHDLASSAWLREWLAVMYENEPRITIDTNPDPYYCFEWGRTSLFFHHGHLKRQGSIDDVFAAKFREVFGRTEFSYAHNGHLHHDKRVESNLMIMEQHRTLASPDAHASRGGWLSGRDAKVITYSKLHGEVARQTLTPEMVKGRAA